MIRTVLMGAALATVSSAAFAQSLVQTSGERMAADHAPMGIRASSFLVIPKVDVDVASNDNIYAASSNTKSDLVTTVRPEVAARSNWNRHALNVVARGERNTYASHSAENTTNYLLAADGRADVLRGTSIGGGISQARDHDDRGNPTSLGTPTKPTEVNTTTGRIGVFHTLQRVNARLDSEVRKIDYKNGLTSAGALVDNKSRDRNEYAQTLRVGYQFDPRFEAFVRGVMDTRAYDRKSVGRSSHGQSYVAGTTFDMSGKSKGEVYAGMIKRTYTNAALKDISAPTFGGKVTWNVSDLTSVIANIDRSIEETAVTGSSGTVTTASGLRVEHALTRDILLSANAGYNRSQYKGATSGQRRDNTWNAGTGVDYYLNRCFKTGLSYAYTKRDSNVVGGDYDRNAVLLRFTATY